MADLMSADTARTVRVTSSYGTKYEVTFHRTADRAWIVQFPGFVDGTRLTYDPFKDAVYNDPKTGNVCIATTSLARAMDIIADHIVTTEF